MSLCCTAGMKQVEPSNDSYPDPVFLSTIFLAYTSFPYSEDFVNADDHGLRIIMSSSVMIAHKNTVFVFTFFLSPFNLLHLFSQQHISHAHDGILAFIV